MNLKSLKMTIGLLWLWVVVAQGQSFTALWKQLNEAERKDLPQTVVEFASRIELKAMQEKQAGQLLKRAAPLMEIYGSDRKEAFAHFLQEDSAEIGSRRSLLSDLPLYTISDGLAKRILSRCGISEQAAILDYVHAERQRIEHILEHSRVCDVLPDISEAEFKRYPVGLSLAGMFYPGDIRLTYPEYREYLAQCDAFTATHSGYTCQRDTNPPFRNIQITILEGSRVIVTKNKSPVIHFVIQHPKMCAAIENMVLPVVEPQPEERSKES